MHVPSPSQRTCPAAKRRAACFGARLKVLQRPWTSQHSRGRKADMAHAPPKHIPCWNSLISLRRMKVNSVAKLLLDKSYLLGPEVQKLFCKQQRMQIGQERKTCDPGS